MIDVVSGDYYFYHFDGLGSVVALSDDTAAIVERYEYDVYGNTTVCDASGTPRTPNASSYGNPYMFTGRRLDDETGLYYYRTRYYSTELGRFMQTDPLGYYDSMNLYGYCWNNPIIWIDPWGLGRVVSRPVDSWWIRKFSNWAYGKGNKGGEHWQIYYDDGTNSGYFGQNKKGLIFRPDLPGRDSLYKNIIFPKISDKHWKAAEKDIQDKWRKEGRKYEHPYNDCQSYINEVANRAAELKRQEDFVGPPAPEPLQCKGTEDGMDSGFVGPPVPPGLR